MQSNFASSLATPRGRRWLILFIGFTVATFQLCGLAIVKPSLFNTVNVGVVLFFYALTWSLKPTKTEMITSPKFGKNQKVSFFGSVGKIKNYQPHIRTWLYEIEVVIDPQSAVSHIDPQTKLLLHEADIQGLEK